MIAAKPPTSEEVKSPVVAVMTRTKRIVLLKLGCWGLVNLQYLVVYVLFCCFMLCASSTAARLPTSAPGDTQSSPLQAETTLSLSSFPPSVYPQPPSSFSPTKPSETSAPSSLLMQQTTYPMNNANMPPSHQSLFSAPTAPLVMSVTNVSTLSSAFSSNSNPLDVNFTSNAVAADRIGQALLDNNYILADSRMCRSEECFEAGMQITEPGTTDPPVSMRQQVADAILLSDVRNKRRESVMHPRNIEPIMRFHEKRQVEPTEYWRNSAFEALHKKLLQRPVEAVAKNIIFFLGDGMSVPTVTAARILKGQQVDHMRFGEEGELHMDTFPYSGLSKTFCSDAQVADSACSATAYLCGVKANSGTIGLTPDVAKNNCSAQNEAAYRLSSILAWAQAAGKSTGVVSTARITHASPAGAYANIANRNWENDHEVKRDTNNPDECDDIAEQLILRDPGRNINVILGGGRLQFLPRTKTDPENGRRGFRLDGKNLIEMWKEDKYQSRYAYVEGKEQLMRVDPSNVDYLLGLFSPSHMEYYHEQEKNDDPSLTDMTAVAVEILSRNPNGFFLFVEGARIDHAHHNNQGLRAIWETVEMDRAIQKADEMTHDEDTLILVTADHSHTFSIAGYPIRGNPISGIAEIALDNLPYTTLSYANGPAYKSLVNNRRYNISNDPVDDLKYKQIPNIPRKSETHGGDDVIILSKGPFAHLFTGVQQQSFIPHALGYAACVGPGPKFCDHVFY